MPETLNETFRFYLWVILLIKNYLGLEDIEVEVVGDSAGGFLALSLTNWCLCNKIERPRKLILIYPAINLDMSKYTTSGLQASDHFLLNFSMLYLCLKSFIQAGDYEDQSDYLVNFLLTPNCFL